jgi:hypothetical protein
MRIRLMILAAVLLVACNKTVAPSDPYSGKWNVDLTKFADSTYFTPSVFVMTITNVGSSYVAAFTPLVYHLANGTTVDTYAIANDSTSFDIDDVGLLTLRVGAPVGSCVLTITGPLNGGLGNGTFSIRNGCGPNASESATWSAAKQP